MMKSLIIMLSLTVICILSSGSAVSGAEGDQLWSRSYNGSENTFDTGEGITTDKDGNVYVVSTETTTGEFLNIFIRKFDYNGNLIWERTHNGPANTGDRGSDIGVDTNGNVFVAGSQSVTGEAANMWLRKYDKDGNTNWTRTENFSNIGAVNDRCRDVVVDHNGDVYVTGFFRFKPNMFIRKYDTGGNVIWTRTHDSVSNEADSGNAVTIDQNNNVYVAGYETITGEGQNIWIRKYDSTGNILLTRTHNGPANGSDQAQDIAVDKDENIYVVGYENSTNNGNNIWLRKYDSSGNTNWTRTYDGPDNNDDKGYSVQVDTNGNVFIAGYEWNNNYNVWLRKYDTDGNIMWTRTEFLAGGANRDVYYDMALDKSANIYTTGYLYVASVYPPHRQEENVFIRKFSCDLQIDTTLPKGEIGKMYQTQLTASGGTTPYKWKAVISLQDTGLTLSSDGIISGIIESCSNIPIKIQVEELFGGITEVDLIIQLTNISDAGNIDYNVAPGNVKVIGGDHGFINPYTENPAKIIFNADRPDSVKIRIFSLNGLLVKKYSYDAAAGINITYWDGRNDNNTIIAPGIYVVHVIGAGINKKTKIVVGN